VPRADATKKKRREKNTTERCKNGQAPMDVASPCVFFFFIGWPRVARGGLGWLRVAQGGWAWWRHFVARCPCCCSMWWIGAVYSTANITSMCSWGRKRHGGVAVGGQAV